MFFFIIHSLHTVETHQIMTWVNEWKPFVAYPDVAFTKHLMNWSFNSMALFGEPQVQIRYVYNSLWFKTMKYWFTISQLVKPPLVAINRRTFLLMSSPEQSWSNTFEKYIFILCSMRFCLSMANNTPDPAYVFANVCYHVASYTGCKPIFQPKTSQTVQIRTTTAMLHRYDEMPFW